MGEWKGEYPQKLGHYSECVKIKTRTSQRLALPRKDDFCQQKPISSNVGLLQFYRFPDRQ